MPTEFRFDDIDLREEPASAAHAESVVYSNPPVKGDLAIFTTTHVCCV
jgi:hypothetical protein